MMDDMNLQMLEEQEQAIRQLEVRITTHDYMRQVHKVSFPLVPQLANLILRIRDREMM
jgi:hypothetical protein